jgi:signal peptidase I
MRDAGDEAVAEAERAGAATDLVARCARLPRFAVAAMVGWSLLSQRAFESYRVAGASMVPAFADGDRIVVAGFPGFFGEPRCGEAVIARIDGEVVIKRIAGLPGDRVEVGDGWLRRNGAPADDVIPPEFHDHADFGPLLLRPDEFFLLGDHRDVSIDSREFGPVRRCDLLGRVILRVPADEPPESAVARERR